MSDKDIPLAGDGLIPPQRSTGLMFYSPRPLVFSQHRVVVSWSTKSACSHTLLWFLAQEGLMDAVRYYADWPHQFRTRVYYQSLTYRRVATAFWRARGRGYVLLRITRAPHKRLISIFRHVLKHDILRKEMNTQLGRRTGMTGVSLQEFARVLEGRDLTVPSEENGHLLAQYHPIWDLDFDRVITLNIDETEMAGGLAEIAADLGLPGADLSREPYFLSIKDRHYAKPAAFAGQRPIESIRFGGTESPPFAKQQLENSDAARRLARRFYLADEGRVHSGDTAGRLFP